MLVKGAGFGGSAPKFSGVSGNSSRPVPPPGTSARKAYDKTVRQGTGAPKTTLERLTYLQWDEYQNPHRRYYENHK